MGRIIFKRGERGIATSYISRKQALTKLQLSLKDFRRLCILKGIYPVEPHHKKRANKNNSKNKTYYYVKDIQFLAHEPLIDKFREFKIFLKRLSKAIGKQDSDARQRLSEKRPIFKLDHLVKERYPTFIDAVRDLDDAISMCFLFSTFPKGKSVKEELTSLCRRLTVEFLHFVVEAKALRKVFVSIKGIYYQAEIMGQLVTWVIPHSFGFNNPSDVDFKIMVTFAQFWSTMLGFINYKLYHSINLVYPPKLAIECPSAEELLKGEDGNVELIAALNHNLKSSVENSLEEEEQIDEFPNQDSDEAMALKNQEESLKKLKDLFAKCKIFLNREVPKESLIFVIKCFGGEVSFDKTVYVGATFEETDQTITHQIIDRPLGDRRYLNRYYIQPQWVYDCVNARMLLPVDLYFPGEVLPPHLSPFVEEAAGDYVPPEKQMLLDYQSGKTTSLRRTEESSDDEVSEDESDEEETKKQAPKRKTEEIAVAGKKAKMAVTPGVAVKDDKQKMAQREAAEEKRLSILAMDKKSKHLYNKIIYGQKRKNREVKKMKEKRSNYEKELKAKRKVKQVAV